MTETSMTWEDGGGGDEGPYSSDQLRLLARVLGRAGVGANVGVVGGYFDNLRPTSPGADQVRAGAGVAIADGRVYENDAGETKTMSRPTGGTTGKRLVIQVDWTAQEVRLVVISSADGTASLPALTQIDGDTWELPLCSFTHATDGTIAALTDEREFVNAIAIPFIIDGGGAVISTGIAAGDISIPRPIHLTGWEVLGDQSGAIKIDVWADDYDNFPPTDADSICGTDEPEIAASGTKARNLAIATGGQWTLDLAVGQKVRFNVDSVTDLTYVTVTLFGAG